MPTRVWSLHIQDLQGKARADLTARDFVGTGRLQEAGHLSTYKGPSTMVLHPLHDLVVEILTGMNQRQNNIYHMLSC